MRMAHYSGNGLNLGTVSGFLVPHGLHRRVLALGVVVSFLFLLAFGIDT